MKDDCGRNSRFAGCRPQRSTTGSSVGPAGRRGVADPPSPLSCQAATTVRIGCLLCPFLGQSSQQKRECVEKKDPERKRGENLRKKKMGHKRTRRSSVLVDHRLRSANGQIRSMGLLATERAAARRCAVIGWRPQLRCSQSSCPIRRDSRGALWGMPKTPAAQGG